MANAVPQTADYESRARHVEVYDDFAAVPVRQRASYTLADGAAGDDLAATIVFTTSRRVLVNGVHIMPDGSAAGVDGSNTSAWTVTDGTNTVATKTYTTNFPADSVSDSLGTIAYGVIEAGGRLELAVTNGATADLPAVRLLIEYTDLEAYCGRYTVTATDDGTVAAADSTVTLAPSDATAGDNDEIYFALNQTVTPAANKTVVAAARIQYAEANTSAANVAFGLTSDLSANLLADNGGGVRATGSSFMIYKVDGETAWRCVTRIGTAVTTSLSTLTAGGSDFADLEVVLSEITPLALTATYRVNGSTLSNAANGLPISHRVTYSGVAACYPVVALKNGSTTAEAVVIDDLYLHYTR